MKGTIPLNSMDFKGQVVKLSIVHPCLKVRNLSYGISSVSTSSCSIWFDEINTRV